MSVSVWGQPGQSGLIRSKAELAVASPALIIPVANGESAGLIRATGFLRSDGTDRNVSILINGANTNVSAQYHAAVNTTLSGARTGTVVCSTGIYGVTFDLYMLTGKRAAGFKRSGMIRAAGANATIVVDVYNSAWHYADATTLITSISLDSGNATGLAIGSYALIEEIAIP
jgi:hypothetical protein